MTAILSDIEAQVEAFFEVSSLKCSCCDELLPEASEKGVSSVSEWDQVMDEKISWLKEHREAVLLHLARLRHQWPKSCESLETILDCTA